MTNYHCAIDASDYVFAARSGGGIYVAIEERSGRSCFLTPSDARALAADLVKLADEIGGVTTVQTTLPNVMAEFDQRLADLEAHLENLQGQFDELSDDYAIMTRWMAGRDAEIADLKRRLGSVTAYMGFPRFQPMGRATTPDQDGWTTYS